MFDLKGKTALITGASGGIGEAVARSIHAQGANVVLHGTRIDKLEALQNELGVRAYSMAVDLSDRGAVAGMVDAARALAGPISILVNNAGITRDGLLMRMRDNDWDTVQEVNLTASMSLCRSAMRGMMKARTGRIISISSVVGLTGNAGQTNYAASKAGMIGFTKSLAREVAVRGITVNAVAPGFIETDMTDNLPNEQKEAFASQIPMGRLGTPDEIAQAVLFLAGEGGSYITGQTLHVNGGMYTAVSYTHLTLPTKA